MEPQKLESLETDDEVMAMIRECFPDSMLDWEGEDGWHERKVLRLIDSHVHLLGTGDSGSGCYLHKHMHSKWHVKQRTIYKALCRAIGYNKQSKRQGRSFDSLYEEVLVRKYREMRSIIPAALEQIMTVDVKVMLLALDQVYDERTGEPDRYRTSAYVPNRYCVEVANRHPDIFVPCISIHPYKRDAVEELYYWVEEHGVRFLKWLPNIQLIDYKKEQTRQFLRAVARLGVTVISHLGPEHSLSAGGSVQEYGNPLLLRIPLDLGVRVIGAHCGGEGLMTDLDHSRPSSKIRKFFSKLHMANPVQQAPVTELFSRLMNDPKYHGRLFGDTAELESANRAGGPLKSVLLHQDWHPRLLHGSDYPLPSIGPSFFSSLARFCVSKKVKWKYLQPLSRLHKFNPPLADICLKRLICMTRRGQKYSFQPSIFLQRTSASSSSSPPPVQALHTPARTSPSAHVQPFSPTHRHHQPGSSPGQAIPSPPPYATRNTIGISTESHYRQHTKPRAPQEPYPHLHPTVDNEDSGSLHDHGDHIVPYEVMPEMTEVDVMD
jgi:mannonate dehydratase